MAKQTTTVLIDDLTGEEAQQTVRFGLDGVEYEIDLTDANAEEVRSQLRRWADAGTRIGGRRINSAPAGKSKSAKVREWAQSQGIEVPPRGRIPSKVLAAYYAVH